MVRAVLFDLDDTIFDHRETSRRALSALRSLTCGLEDVAAHDTASVTLPLTVVGPGQTATIRVQAGSQVLATTAVPLGL